MQAVGLRASTGLRRAGPSALGTRLPCKPAHICSARRSGRQAAVTVQARYSAAGGGGNWSVGSPGIADRVLAALPYLLPFFDCVMYGRYLFYMYPAIKMAVQPLLPAMSLYHSIPMGSFIAFFGLYIAVVNNRSMSRFVRFNAVQAILLDILLALPRLLETVLTPPSAGWGLQAYIHSQSFIWIFTTAWVVFGIVNSLLGTLGRIPFIADAADQQIR